MNQIRKGQRGVTILQVLVGVSASALIFLGVLESAINRQRQATLADVAVTAQSIASAADSIARAVTDTTTGPNWRWQYEFANRSADFRTVDELNPLLDQPLPEVTFYGTNYEFLASSGVTLARFEVPAEDARRVQFQQGAYDIEVLASGNVRVTVEPPRDLTIIRSRRNREVKHFFFEETTR